MSKEKYKRFVNSPAARLKTDEQKTSSPPVLPSVAVPNVWKDEDHKHQNMTLSNGNNKKYCFWSYLVRDYIPIPHQHVYSYKKSDTLYFLLISFLLPNPTIPNYTNMWNKDGTESLQQNGSL